ncbi:alpha/beta hydrolase fold domain-containing protein [Penicillium lagena]|uniref:alpha/beta hydrolase fold domain-containing protein n=1 Tax=Penicillium lagena TaxID=94218 RepID=UPI0025410B4D|nr:alpha/beta hydrolase fold domain-containing protein [Penicillium lagena]KAJ5606249.1 alpha/beta hydrolase fold domain-containing protein [Penicillium lagena]
MENHNYPENKQTLTLPSGRILAWTIHGGPLRNTTTTDLDAKPPAIIFYFHGFPGCSLEANFLSTSLLQRHNARCIAIDRPGMDQSTHHPERRLLDWPADVLAIADYLDIPQFSILGTSGGGPYALACAYAIPRVDSSSPDVTAQGRGRLRGVALVCAMYPTSLGVKGMLTELKIVLAVGRWVPRFITAAFLDRFIGRQARDKDPTVLEKKMDRAMARRHGAEREAWEDARVRATAVGSLRGAFRQGGMPVATELSLLSSSDWGFRVEDIDGNGLRLWHGMLDQNAPFEMAEKAAKLMPGAKTHFFEQAGHLSMAAGHIDAIVADLVGG